MPSLTIRAELLKPILQAITPSAATSVDDLPTSFMETVQISEEQGETTFLCTDGFRAHRVELPTEHVTWTDPSGDLVVGVDFFKEICEDPDLPDVVRITAVESHTRWVVNANGQKQEFTINPWPDMKRLISDEALGDEEVAFNLDYFADLIDAMETWGALDPPDDDEDDRPNVIPLRVHQLQKRKVNHFSMRNDMGTLRVLLMPIVLKDSEWR